MRILMAALVGLFCAAAVSCSPRTASGVYVASDANSASMLQLVQTADGHLSGSLQNLSLNGQNEIDGNTLTLSGSADGDALTLSTPERWFAAGETFSGSHRGDELTLTITGTQGVNNIVFRASSADEFTALSTQLRKRAVLRQQAAAQQRAAAQAAAQDATFRSAISGLTNELEQTAHYDEQDVPIINGAISGFTGDIDQMGQLMAARNRESDGLQRGQYNLAMGQIHLATDQQHQQLQAVESQFVQHRARLQEDAARANAWCLRTQDAVCMPFTNAYASYLQAADVLARSLRSAEAAYSRAAAEEQRMQAS